MSILEKLIDNDPAEISPPTDQPEPISSHSHMHLEANSVFIRSVRTSIQFYSRRLWFSLSQLKTQKLNLKRLSQHK